MPKALSVSTVSGIALSCCRLSLSTRIVLFMPLALYCIGVNPGPFTWGFQGNENTQQDKAQLEAMEVCLIIQIFQLSKVNRELLLRVYYSQV